MQRKRILWVLAVTLVLGIGALAASVELWPEKKGTSPRAPRVAPVAQEHEAVKPATAAPPSASTALEKHSTVNDPKPPAKGTPSVVQQAPTPGYYIDSKTGERKEMPFTIIATPMVGPGGQAVVGKAVSIEPAKPIPAPGEGAPAPAPAPDSNTEEKKPE